MKPFPVRVQLFNESSVQVSFSGHFRDSQKLRLIHTELCDEV